tara:strand:- start:323 stop:1213 length:891 start_codon:yes stop_codon:yes gene_type:complete
MPRIHNIAIDQVIHGTDILLGSDQKYTTRNYHIADIAAWMNATNAVGAASSFTWIFRDNADEGGEFSANASNWKDITNFKVSKYQIENNVDAIAPEAIKMLENRDIVIIELNNVNHWGVYHVQSIAVDGTDSNFYNFTVIYKDCHDRHDGDLSTFSSPTQNLNFAVQDMATDGNFVETVRIAKNLRRTITTVTDSPSGTFTCDLNLNDNFKFTVNNASNQTIAMTIADENIGQSGNILITNPSSVGSLSFAQLPSYMKTPLGATVVWDTTADKIAVISYIVLAIDTVLVNYIGDFS